MNALGATARSLHQASPAPETGNSTSVDQRICSFDGDCPNGSCRHFNETNGYCVCDKNWISRDGGLCNYQQEGKVKVFLISLFVGEFGVDWFVLAKGHARYIVAGVFKLLTLGGLGIWWIVDWIRVLADAFPDGNGVGVGTW